MIGRIQIGGKVVSAVMRQGLAMPITVASQRSFIVVPTVETLLDRTNTTFLTKSSTNNKTSSTSSFNYCIDYRNFSTASLKTDNDNNSVEDSTSKVNLPPTRALTVDAVKKIMDELRSIDDNSDQRYVFKFYFCISIVI
jgi:hypothetical protein